MTSTKWSIDPTHSEVVFKVKHLMISTVTGHFKVFEGQAETDADNFLSVKNIEFKADVNSISTNNDQRDGHLRSADFFAAEENPEIIFSADKFEVGDGKIQGQLTIRNTTRPVTLDVEFGGVVVDPYGQTKAGLTVTGKISRKEFGLTYHAVTEAGNVMVSDEVKLNTEVQFTKVA